MSLEQIFTNVYFYTASISCLLLAGLLVLIAKLTQYSATVRWLQFYLGCILLIVLAQTMAFFGKSAAIFDASQSLVLIAVLLYVISIVYFVLNFLNKQKWLESLWLPIGLVAGTIVIIIVDFRTHLLYTQDPALRTLHPWGYTAPTAKHLAIYTLWVESIAFSAMISMAVAWRHTHDPIRRKQTLILVLGMMIPAVVGGISQGVLPLFGIQLATSSLYTQVVEGVMLTFGLVWYGPTLVDPGMIAAGIVQTMSNAALALNPNGSIIFANQTARQLFTPAGKDLVGLPVQSLVAPAQWKEFDAQFLRLLGAEGASQVTESAILDANGKKLAVNAYGSTYRDKRGRVLAFIVIFADIQAQKELLADATRLGKELAAEKQMVETKVIERTRELHEEQARLRASIEGLAPGFILVDNRNHIVVQNKALQTIFGLAGPAASVTQLSNHLPSLDLIKQCKMVREKGRVKEIKEIGMGAKILHLFISPVKITENDKTTVIGTVILVEDISEEKVLARSKDEFFSIASHELRTPLTAIRGNASMLLKYYAEILAKDPELKGMVSDIHESSTRLIDIVGDFLDMSRIEQGKMSFHPEPISLEKAVESVLYEIGPVVEAKHLTLQTNNHTLESLPKVWADRDRVTQVLYNLIGNAVKFTDTGSVRVDTAVSGRFIRLRVSDTGRGIPLKNQKLLFHKFQQAGDSLLTRDTTRGTGLGLYISKLMAEGMGGSIGLEHSEEGKGTVFYFDIPIATETQLATSTPTDAPKAITV